MPSIISRWAISATRKFIAWLGFVPVLLYSLYHMQYDHGREQWLTIDCGDRRECLFLDLAFSCLDRLQPKLICDGLKYEVVGGTRVNKCQRGVVTLAARAFVEVHQHYKVWW